MITDRLGGYVDQPKFCGMCGAPLLAVSRDVYDRRAGEKREPVVTGLKCPNAHEEWGRNALGAWLLA